MMGPDRGEVLRQLALELRRLVAERAAKESELKSAFGAAEEAAERQYEEARRHAAAQHARQHSSTEAEYIARRDEITAQFQADHAAAEEEYDQTRRNIATRFDEAQNAAKKRHEETRWQASTVFEAGKIKLDAALKEAEQELESLDAEIRNIGQQAEQLLLRRRVWRDPGETPAPSAPISGDATPRCRELVGAARESARKLSADSLPAIFEGSQPLGIVVVIVVAVAALTGLAVTQFGWYPIPVGVIAAVGLPYGILRWLHHLALQRAAQGYAEVVKVLADAREAHRASAEAAQARWKARRDAMSEKMRGDLAAADEELAESLTTIARQQEEQSSQAADNFAAIRREITSRHNRQRGELENKYTKLLEEIDARLANETSGLAKSYGRSAEERAGRRLRQWDAMATQWMAGMRRIETAADRLVTEANILFPDWSSLAAGLTTLPKAAPSAIPFGKVDLRLNDLESGLPEDPRLMPGRDEFSLPAMFSFREHSLFLLKSRGEGRLKAVEILQAMMLRILLSLPPGKVRFLILDPVGLGESFSAFMHLTDYNEQLVSSRIWTDGAHLERRLADLTEHMENVLQMYLRNEYGSLQEYNQSVGELSEPYRVLVVANFPANFSEAAAKRLTSIVSSGARCGVYTLMSVDMAARMPRDFHLADLDRQAVTFTWNEGQFIWNDPDLGTLPLELTGPPPAEPFTELVRRVGQQARDADRVELPFALIAPEPNTWWTADSRGGIDVPVGRSGVNKLQNLKLGKGTSQHVLMSGKTGSGKSTLLHVLIANLAMRYSPDEIELYLIDFKKGVEFKAYAESELPHARVVAIESEREFGLSVLERLDWELTRRGELFRERGVQDLPAFRAAEPSVKMPRAVLIVDEFQELFVEDDRIAQNASLFLDRLVRQGRAFGIHVLLGSQTLAGAYSIPRATIGQMAVRIALQCSESDAHLILSEENTAARLLSRPGEAIYNDANGAFEGNHPFQVVWLPDEERQRTLNCLRNLAKKRECVAPRAIVFEGNVAADLSQNQSLGDLLTAPDWPATTGAVKAWLGEPVAIKEATAATFVRQSGSSLLVVGHHHDSALGILSGAVISLAAQHEPSRVDDASSPAQFYILDGARPDNPDAGYWNRLSEALPHAVKVAAPRAAAGAMAEIAAELARRQQSGQDDAPPIYLIVHDLGRFHDLRKAEDDFGFSRFDADKPLSPAQQFRAILHDGPAFGIHAILWADGLNSVLRSLDRQGLGDLEMRVALRMNPGDSSSLIDSPAASQLNPHRAIFDDESLGRQEKFRPYGRPSEKWLDWLKEQFRHRVEAGARQVSG